MQGQNSLTMKRFGGARKLTPQERAYILDKISGASFYADQFGELSYKEEQKIIISIYNKIQK